MEKYREGQKELHCVFVDLEKAYDKVPREEVWYCMRKSGLAEKYVRIVQYMYDDSTTAVRCVVGVTEGFEVKVGLHQGSALSPCLFAIMMDRMTDEIREEAPWTLVFSFILLILLATTSGVTTTCPNISPSDPLNFVSGTGIELVSSRVNTELKCIFNSSAIKNPCVIIFPALSSSGPTLSRTFCLLRTYA